MTGEIRLATHWIVCAVGEDAYRLPGGEWPCDSRYVSLRDAARLLGVSAVELWHARAEGGVPTDPFHWVSLDWVNGILRTRERVA